MIRIIVLFGPFAAIFGAYGLACVLSYFGNIARKKTIISRRRKRQAKQSMGPGDTAVVFIFVGVLMIVQVTQTVTIQVEQNSYMELIAGGSYQDWPQALAWMNQHLDESTVICSWWDYGYWTAVGGNTTSVNDNGTDNETRMGLTGYAMMQDNEIASLEAFRALHAQYVLVYFGHLINQLGGDEGKWPWMLRIANEETSAIEQMLPRVTTGEGAWGANEIFDEDAYMNSSSGLYSQPWFDSTLVKLMFYGEPTNINEATNSLGYYFAAQVDGAAATSSTSAVTARTTTNGQTWAQVIPDHGAYNFEGFSLAYESENDLVKIYQIDYTALDTTINVTNAQVYSNGLGSATVTNTGQYSVNLGNVTIASESNTGVPIDVSQAINANQTSTGYQTIDPGQSNTIWFNASKPLYDGRGATISVDATTTGEFGQTITVTAQAPQILITDMPYPSIAIDRSQSHWGTIYGSNQMNVTVDNTGPIPVLLQNVASSIYGAAPSPASMLPESEFFPYIPGSSLLAPPSYVIVPGSSLQVYFDSPIGATPGVPNNVTISTAEGATDSAIITNSTAGYGLSLESSSYTTLPEGAMQTSVPLARAYIPVTLGKSTAWSNQTISFAVQNTGSYRECLNNVSLLDGQWYQASTNEYPQPTQVSFTTNDGNIWFDPGQTKVVTATIPSTVNPDDQISIYVDAIGGTNMAVVAADMGIMQVINPYASVDLFPGGPDSPYSYVADANGTLQYYMKNDGNQSITFNSASINGTVFSLGNGTFYNFYPNGTQYVAPSATLTLQQVGMFSVDVRAVAGLRLNGTNPTLAPDMNATQCDMGVNFTAADGSTAIANITTYTQYDYNTYFCAIQTGSSALNYTSNAINLAVTNYYDTQLTLEALIVNGTSIDITPSMVLNPVSADTPLILPGYGTSYLRVPYGSYTSPTTFKIIIVTWEGAIDETTFSI
jgi:archaellum component FlaG (FlaF/FlaG flagellin family)